MHRFLCLPTSKIYQTLRTNSLNFSWFSVFLLPLTMTTTQALNAAAMYDRLALGELKDRNITIQASCALTGEGLGKGLGWLSTQLSGGNTGGASSSGGGASSSGVASTSASANGRNDD